MAGPDDARQVEPRVHRFSLESVFINGTVNGYRNSQLVLKMQIGLAPRRPYTGSQTRTPISRPLLMVHVKDRADELERLELDSFSLASADTESASQHTIDCFTTDHVLVFRYPKPTENNLCTLTVKFRTMPEFDTALQELRVLKLNIRHVRSSEGLNTASENALVGLLVVPTNDSLPVFRPFSHSPNLHSPSSSTASQSGTHAQYSPYMDGIMRYLPPSRPPSQPTGQALHLHSGRPSVTQRPATTMGIPGILGEGIYKISKISTTTSGRPRPRRPPITSRFQGSALYTVSKHLDKTLGSQDNVDAPGRKFLHEDRSHSTRTGEPGRSSANADSRQRSLTDKLPLIISHDKPQSLENLPSVLDEHQNAENNPHQPKRNRWKRLSEKTVDKDLLSRYNAAALHESQQASRMASIPEDSPLMPNDQFSSISRDRSSRFFSSRHEQLLRAASFDDKSYPHSKQTRMPSPGLVAHEIDPSNGKDDNLLLRIAGLNQEGLREATRLWEDLMEKGRHETDLVDDLETAFQIWAKYGEAWAKRLDKIAAATFQKMKHARDSKGAS
ncbi:hypothetical protein B0T26DRAFT_422275 [Lasiosphaeria miniovina]|uniref:Uncharacterized protein n=1 Tax=Lasiosphaeria miniovina TaxID=1954250 RepID=A0AA40A5P3_9PEZI|nr:uncharacterized protein B0T26DRAFT_422275 [Lasiosphaeria miniovina]KAK0709757.1 hypothetical protein B0T26DRAFT_422275 [Lasiosphaeria miniovina]